MNTTRWLTTVLMLGLLAGCSNSKEAPPVSSTIDATPPAKNSKSVDAGKPAMPAPELNAPKTPDAVTTVVKETPKPPAPPVAPPKPAGIEIPNTPDGTVMVVSKSLSEGKPEVLWLALPKKYQDDIKGVITEFSGKVDKDVWDKAFGVINKVTKLAKEKKTFILAHPLAATGPLAANKDKIEVNWDSVIGIIEMVTGSELKTLDGLKSLDPQKFLAGTGTKVTGSAMKLAGAAGDVDPIEKFKSLKVSVVSVDGDTATLKIEQPGEEPKENKLKKVDGKWLPADIVDGWDENIIKAKEGIAKINLAGEQKAQAMGILGMVEGIVDQLQSAKSQEEFDSAVNGAMAMFGGGAGPGGPGPGGAAPPPPKLDGPKLNQ